MNKTTKELIEMMKSSRDYPAYRQANADLLSRTFMEPERALSVLLEEKRMKKSEVIARSGLEVHYAYQIFSGAKKPSRDKLLMLCFGFRLGVEETEQLLKITGYPPLYAKNERDNAILFGLTRGLSVIEINDLLYDQDLDILV